MLLRKPVLLPEHGREMQQHGRRLHGCIARVHGSPLVGGLVFGRVLPGCCACLDGEHAPGGRWVCTPLSRSKGDKGCSFLTKGAPRWPSHSCLPVVGLPTQPSTQPGAGAACLPACRAGALRE